MLAKELERVIPHSKRVLRGKSNVRNLVDYMVNGGFDELVTIETRKGNPGGLVFYRLDDLNLRRLAVFQISGVSLQLDHKVKFHSSTLGVELDEEASGHSNVYRVYEFLADLLKSDLYHEPRGRPCNLRVSLIDGEISLSFVDAVTNKRVYPTLKIERILWEK